MKFLTVEEVIEIHDKLINEYGGLHGIRDMGLLISAIEMPKAMMFGEYLHDSIYDKASAYLFHIICNHAFLDGNKRTGAAVTLIFLKQNEIEIRYNIPEFEEMVCNVAQSQLTKNQISEYFLSVAKEELSSKSKVQNKTTLAAHQEDLDDIGTSYVQLKIFCPIWE